MGAFLAKLDGLPVLERLVEGLAVQISWCALVVVPVGAAGITFSRHPSGVPGSVLCGGRGRVMGCISIVSVRFVTNF